MHYLGAKQYISYETLPHIAPQRKPTDEASNTTLCQAASQETWSANKLGCIIDWELNSADDRLSTKAARDRTSARPIQIALSGMLYQRAVQSCSALFNLSCLRGLCNRRDGIFVLRLAARYYTTKLASGDRS